MRLKKLTLPALGLNLFVILWGAFVRASGSGAGCGSHWPLCNGQVLPQSPSIHTLIEFTHRATSGLCLILALAIAWLAWRENPARSRLRRAGTAVLLLTLTEALIGAGLVLLGLVDKDRSFSRAVSICLHLTNTFALMAALTLTHWWSHTPPKKLKQRQWSATGPTAVLSSTVLLAITGAIAALGDTLFKSTSLVYGIRQDLAPGAHFLLKLRTLHPFLAIGVGTFIFVYADRLEDQLTGRAAKIAKGNKHLVLTQLAIGGLNLVLLAPTAVQILHLLVAQLLWMALVILSSEDRYR